MRWLLGIAVFLILCFSFLGNGASGAEFCVNTDTEFQSALEEAALNGEDDIIKVQQEMYYGTFKSYSLNDVLPYRDSITLLGGYTSGCASRVIAQQLPSSMLVVTMNCSALILPVGIYL